MEAKPYKSIPSPKSHWLLGHTPGLAKGMLQFIRKHQKTHGPIFSADPPFVKLVITSDPKIAKHVLQENNRNYRKSYGYKILRIFLGNGLLTNEGENWRKQRRLAQPAFYKSALANLAKYMVEESFDLGALWSKAAESEKILDVDKEMNGVTLRIVARALFGTDVSGNIDQIASSITLLNKFAMKRILKPFRLPVWVPGIGNIKAKKAIQILDDIIFGIIAERRKSGIERHDLTGMLMAATYEDTGEHMNDRQLRDELMTIFVAGHETTSNAMAWALHMISKHPEVGIKIRNEANEVFGDKRPDAAGIRKLTYTLQVIEETMRLFPPAWIMGRSNIEDDTIEGFHIPANTNVLISIYEIHRRPDLWPDPEKFNPENFAPDKRKSIDKFAYFPFGGGPRLCIGNNFALMEMQVLLACIMQSVNLQPVADHPIELEPNITLRPKHGIKLKLSPVG